MISAEYSIAIARPVDEVFAFVADILANEAKWHTDVVEVIRPASGEAIELGSSVVWVIDFMGRNEYTAEVTAFEPNRRIEITGREGPMKPTLNQRFESVDGTTRYTRQLDMPTEGIFRIMEPLFRVTGVARKRQVRFAQNLKNLLEN